MGPSLTKKICLVEVWFGPFPAWHDFYLKTCAANPQVNWLIFHDAPRPRREASNVRFAPLTKGEFERKASEVLGTDISITTGFKVTDLRPAFGAIFSDCLAGFDFWGYNDCDLFWGDIASFVTDSLLDNYDVVTGCRACVVGQFTLFRNAGISRHFHQLIPNYVQAAKRPTPGNLDERPVDAAAVAHHLRIFRRQLQVHDVNSPDWEARARAMELAERGNLDDWFWEEGPCRWRDGKIIHLGTQKEAMFVHFKAWKSLWKKNEAVPPHLPFRDRLLEGFVVSEKGLTPLYRKQAWAGVPCYFLAHFGTNKLRQNWHALGRLVQRLSAAVRRRL